MIFFIVAVQYCHIFHLTTLVHSNVLSPNLNELTVVADLRYSRSLFQRWESKKLKAASPLLFLDPGNIE